MIVGVDVGRNTKGPSMETWGTLAMLCSVLFIGSSAFLIKLSEVQPVATAFYRMLFALPFFYIWMSLRPRSPSLSSSVISRLMLAGAFLACDLALWHSSFLYTTVANATLFACLLPFIVVPLSYFFFHEKITKIFFLGLFVAVAGIILLFNGKINPLPKQFYGDTLAVSGAFFYALYLLSISQLRGQCTLAQVMLWSSIGSLLTLGSIAFIFETQLIPSTFRALGILMALSLLAQIGGQSLLAFALGVMKPSLTSLMVLLQPPAAAFFAYLIFNETLSGLEIIGMMTTLVGVLIAKRSQQHL